MIKSLLKWTDLKATNAQADTNAARGLAKATGLGAIETVVDLCAVAGLFGLVNAVISSVKK